MSSQQTSTTEHGAMLRRRFGERDANCGNVRNHSYKFPVHRARRALAMLAHHVWLCAEAVRPLSCVHCRTDPQRIWQHMPALKNQQLEFFAREIAAMTPVDSAYVAAGFKASLLNWHDGNTLTHHPAVAARIEELRAEFRERALLHAEYLQQRRLQRLRRKSHAQA
jgi:hypothetical protein